MFIVPANEDWNTEGFYWSFIHIIIYDDITPVFFASYTSIGCSPSSSHLTLCVDRFLRFTWCGWKRHYYILFFPIHLWQAIGQGRRTEKRGYAKSAEVQALLVPSLGFNLKIKYFSHLLNFVFESSISQNEKKTPPQRPNTLTSLPLSPKKSAGRREL